MTAVLACLIVVSSGVLLVAPQRIRLDQAPPVLAVAIWSSALVLRAALVVIAAAGALIVLPATAPLQAAARWCWHTILPVIAQHIRLDGHQIADAAILLPTAIVALSVVSVAAAVFKGLRAVKRLLAGTFGPGPATA